MTKRNSYYVVTRTYNPVTGELIHTRGNRPGREFVGFAYAKDIFERSYESYVLGRLPSAVDALIAPLWKMPRSYGYERAFKTPGGIQCYRTVVELEKVGE